MAKIVKMLCRVSVVGPEGLKKLRRGKEEGKNAQGKEDERLVCLFEGAAGSWRGVGCARVPVVVLCGEDEGC